VEELLADLAAATIGETFNQYRDDGPDAVPGAAALRVANLRTYLAERGDADVLMVGEAAGYQGMRWSGIAFTSERDLGRWGGAFARTSAGRPPWSEPSGTIVHRTLDRMGAERRVILWNTVPTHPHHPGRPLSNRRPRAGEAVAGASFLERAIELLAPRRIVALGRVAEAAVGPRGLYVRHPSMGGAPAFIAAMERLLGGR
jgi:uracil-DNA glycosylase